MVAVLGLGTFAYVEATQPAYACSTEWTPTPTGTPVPGATQRLGYPQPDQGRSHVVVGTAVKYLYCPPASGNHYFQTNLGPIPARVYNQNEHPAPEGWVHNLEHGALVILYKCPGDACTDAGQAKFSQFYQAFPNSPVCDEPPGIIGPVIARFDDMAFPYAAIVWDEVLPLQTFDTSQILAFYQQQGERTNPEPQCQPASAAPGSPAPGTPVPGAS